MVKKTVMSQLQQLQTVSEATLEKLSKNQATRSAIQGATQLRERGDRILRGLDSIEERLTAIEKRLAGIEAQGRKAATRTRTRATKSRPPATRAQTDAAKPAPAPSEPTS